MSESSICKELVTKCTQTLQVSDAELQTLLACKAEGKLDFLLVDIREMFEYSDKSIENTDLLLPTSTIHQHMDTLIANKERFILLYCRTGNRTSHMLSILKRMGFEQIAHLTHGIVGYSGATLKNAQIPNEF